MTIDKKYSELRYVREKLKKFEEKFSHENKIHDQTLQEIIKLENILRKSIEKIKSSQKFENPTENNISHPKSKF